MLDRGLLIGIPQEIAGRSSNQSGTCQLPCLARETCCSISTATTIPSALAQTSHTGRGLSQFDYPKAIKLHLHQISYAADDRR